MISSTLQINGPHGAGMTIGGEFDQNNSAVSGNQVNVGYIGPGIYNLNSGTLAVSQLWALRFRPLGHRSIRTAARTDLESRTSMAGNTS